MKLITFHPDAEAEATEAAQFYERASTGLGYELIGEMKRAIEQIGTNPEACQLIGSAS
ncbi:MAG: hypothetical protein HZA20_12580 [Nitrospirae bacterium]|nr:hypothetical protein [Nitrospirota bacterium]